MPVRLYILQRALETNIPIDQNKQQGHDADPKAIKQINFTGNLDCGRNKHFISKNLQNKSTRNMAKFGSTKINLTKINLLKVHLAVTTSAPDTGIQIMGLEQRRFTRYHKNNKIS